MEKIQEPEDLNKNIIEEYNKLKSDFKCTFLDDNSFYYFDIKNDIIVKRHYDENYKKKDLIEYYKNDDTSLKLDKDTYYIIDKSNNLVFLPMYSRRRTIRGYTYTEYDNFDIVKDYCPRLSDKGNRKYVIGSYEGKHKSMSELIFGRKAEKGCHIDHINNITLDNRKQNLRELTYAENSSNTKKSKGASSRFIGVSLSKNDKKWKASIKYKDKLYNLGSYDDEFEAMKVRDTYSLYLHKRDISLNKDIYGISYLTKKEIEYIMKHGIPEKYKFKKKERDLPQNIYHRYGKYQYKITRKGKVYNKTFVSLVEAITSLNMLKNEFEYKELHRKNIKESIIYRKNDIAVLRTKNKYGNIIGEYYVDDRVYSKFIHTSWVKGVDDYAIGKFKGKTKSLHIHVYETFIGELKEGYQVDHINRNRYDARIKNLRLINFSNQSQNRNPVNKSLIPYKGITLSGTGFSACCKNRRSELYEYMEDAARQYNNYAKQEFKSPYLNVITTKKTTQRKIYHKDFLTLEKLENVDTVRAVRAIVRNNVEWKEKLNIINMDKINCDNIDDIKKRIVALFKNGD